MKFLAQIQGFLEETYGARTGLDVRDFVRVAPAVPGLGQLLVEEAESDLNVALLLDRDVFSAWSETQTPQAARSLSVPFEEVSHFVYLSFNHNRRRSVTALEMELQSEIDRIVLAFHGPWSLSEAPALLRELFEQSYPDERYETSRRAALRFLQRLAGGDPRAWSPAEFEQLRRFFHSDLSEKLRLSLGDGN